MGKVVEVTYIPFNEQGFIDPSDIKKAFRSNTKMVVLK